MRQQLLDCLRIEDSFHELSIVDFRFPIVRQATSIGNRQLAIGNVGYGAGLAEAVAGFLLLNSVIKARVMSILSAM